MMLDRDRKEALKKGVTIKKLEKIGLKAEKKVWQPLVLPVGGLQ